MLPVVAAVLCLLAALSPAMSARFSPVLYELKVRTRYGTDARFRYPLSAHQRSIPAAHLLPDFCAAEGVADAVCAELRRKVEHKDALIADNSGAKLAQRLLVVAIRRGATSGKARCCASARLSTTASGFERTWY